ncbi:CRISPR-associated protein Cas4 [Thermovibrio sp.]
MVDLKRFTANGTLIWYYYTCKREVWFISHGIEPPQDNEKITVGRLIHEEFFKRKKKEVFIDGKLKIDLLENKKIVGEIKKSSRYLKSAVMQLLFYLFYLEEVKGEKLEGVLVIPEEKKRIKVKLTDTGKQELVKAIKEIEEIVKLPRAPKLKESKYCKSCAYRELCWS